MYKIFFQLLQVALGNRKELSICPDEKQWAGIFQICQKQALAGIGFAGITQLPKEQCPPKLQVGQWMKIADKIRKRNGEMTEMCKSVCEFFKKEGFNSCILKGQSNLINYPEHLRNLRIPGDIDIWVAPNSAVEIADKGHAVYSGNRAVIEYILMKHRQEGAAIMPEVNYHHIDWKYEGIETEVHFRPSWLNSPLHNFRLQKWCNQNAQWENKDSNGIPVPTAEFNAVYQLLHVYRHLFSEGIGLRQLLDYYMVLKSLSSSSTPEKKQEVLDTLQQLGVKQFAAAVMFALQKAFAMPEEYLLCEPDEERGKFLLREVMLAGNFGRYDSRNIIKAGESYPHRFIRRQKRFLRFLNQYPTEVIWGPYFTVMQRMWRILHGWR